MFKSNIKTYIIQSIGTIIGSFIMALAVSQFLLPNELSSGGFSGIATITYYLFKIPMGTTILILNIPMFILAGFKIGKEFFIKSIIGTISLSIFIDMLDKLPALTDDKFLACIYGGILAGIGTAIILKSHSSTGGSDLLTNIIKKINPKLEMGNILVLIDFVIVTLNVIFLRNFEIGLYSTIAIYLMGFMVDVIFEGVYFTKLLVIISDKNEEIATQIETTIHRGATGLYGKGMYTNKEKLVLICAAGRHDVANVKQLVLKIDPNAFLIVTNSREVLGYGFKE
ncbi:MAG: YitT family protein [Clostridia bacterium]|nr:YitT family protein [Clostridia bacterium]